MKIVLGSDGSIELARGEHVTRGQNKSRQVVVEWAKGVSPIDTGQILADNMVVEICITRPDGEQSGWLTAVKVDGEIKYLYILQAWDTAVSGEASLQVRWYDITQEEANRIIEVSNEAFFIIDNGKIAQPLNLSSENYNDIVLQFITPLSAQSFRKYDVNALPDTIRYSVDGEKTAPALYYNFVEGNYKGLLFVNKSDKEQTELLLSDGNVFIRTFKLLDKAGEFRCLFNVKDDFPFKVNINYSTVMPEDDNRKNEAYGRANVSGGHKTKTYQKDTFGFGAGVISGMSQTESFTIYRPSTSEGGGNLPMTVQSFNDFYWDSVNNVPKNGGLGKDANGNVLDRDGNTYENSYGLCITTGNSTINTGKASRVDGENNVNEAPFSNISGRYNWNKEKGENSNLHGYYNTNNGKFNTLIGQYCTSYNEIEEYKGDFNYCTLLGYGLKPSNDNCTIVGKGGGNKQREFARKLLFGVATPLGHQALEVYDDDVVRVLKAPNYDTDVVRLKELNTLDRKVKTKTGISTNTLYYHVYIGYLSNDRSFQFTVYSNKREIPIVSRKYLQLTLGPEYAAEGITKNEFNVHHMSDSYFGNGTINPSIEYESIGWVEGSDPVQEIYRITKIGTFDFSDVREISLVATGEV